MTSFAAEYLVDKRLLNQETIIGRTLSKTSDTIMHAEHKVQQGNREVFDHFDAFQEGAVSTAKASLIKHFTALIAGNIRKGMNIEGGEPAVHKEVAKHINAIFATDTMAEATNRQFGAFYQRWNKELITSVQQQNVNERHHA